MINFSNAMGGGGGWEYSYNERIILKMCYIQALLDFVLGILVTSDDRDFMLG